MLAVFRRDVNHPADPLTPEVADPKYIPALRNGYLLKHFSSLAPSVFVKLGSNGYIAYFTNMGLSPNPRPMFCIRDGIYCICRCSIKTMEERNKAGEKRNESDILVARYTDLIKQGNNNPFDSMKNSLDGDYNYILYDSLANKQNSVRRTVAVNCWQDKPLYYGLDSDGYCIISDSLPIIGKVCGELTNIKDIPIGYVLKIPVLMEPKPGEVVGSSSGDRKSDKESAGESSEANPLVSSSISVPVAVKDELTETTSEGVGILKTASGGGEPAEVSSSGDRLSEKESAGETSEAKPLALGSSSITVPAASKDEMTETRSEDDRISKTASGGGESAEASSSGVSDHSVSVDPKE